MDIILNNSKEHFEKDRLTVQELLDIKNFTFKLLIIRINGILVKKEFYSEAEIKNGDDVMVLHLISGG